LEIARFSVQPLDDLVEATDKEEVAYTRVLLASRWVALGMAALGTVVQRPFQFAKTMRVVTAMARKSDCNFLGHRLLRVIRVSGQASYDVGAYTHPGLRATLFGAVSNRRL